MRLSGEQRIAADRQAVWEALNDPDILRQCIPGCRALDREPDGSMRATVEIKIGPIGTRFQGAVTLSDIDAPNSYTITGNGQGGTVGHASGSARVRLTDDPAGTLLTHEVGVDVGGRLAQLGGPLIDATARQLADRFFRRFGELVASPAVASADEAGPPRLTASASPAAETAPGPAYQPRQQASAATSPIAWILAVAVAALGGYLVGHGLGGAGSDWMGLAIGLAFVVIAAAAFEAGRRAGSTVVTLNSDTVARLFSGPRS